MADSQRYKNGRKKDRSLQDSLNNRSRYSNNSADDVNNLSNNIAGVKSHKHSSNKNENNIHDNFDKIIINLELEILALMPVRVILRRAGLSLW
jgi:hypothetical protein